ncbi:type II toxin-antitoxin system antitoxin SocA domain-containing protein [Lactobacillus sp. AN1001]|jgi:uncharacterized phage-associated protein/DNA-binding transcriptional regulator YiaG|uniref:type II toxin-antitoxin system antitoxin SocA domain-containing protein n=1 Tax=Ligilactobacillus animalis TaxID=1605 RepID=UPI002597D657|nr:type II toxin-antitoxin system antitoxin SocA domain-containing protein [Ligilactobacillus animalis]
MTYQKDFTTTYTINGHEYTVTAPALFDSNTNELIPDKELDDKAAEIARQQYRNDMGLVTPKDLKEYRAKLGISQRNLAELTGLSPNTVALYESGAFPTTANNKLLKSLINNDEVLRQYMINDSKNYSTELVAKVDRYFQNEDSVVGVEKENPRYTAVQLANWFRVENYFERELDLNIEPVTQMKVIKLLYMAYGRYLAKTRNKLFSSPIIHMQYGPVVTEVHDKFKCLTVLDHDKPSKEAMDDYTTVSQDNEISELLDNVNQCYINYNAARLSKLTHQPGSPWNMTPDRMIIKDQLIFDTFSRGIES